MLVHWIEVLMDVKHVQNYDLNENLFNFKWHFPVVLSYKCLDMKSIIYSLLMIMQGGAEGNHWADYWDKRWGWTRERETMKCYELRILADQLTWCGDEELGMGVCIERLDLFKNFNNFKPIISTITIISIISNRLVFGFFIAKNYI